MVQKNISVIVAIAKNNAIGKDNNLLWHLGDDMKIFKSNTVGKPVIMGRKTFQSLPKGALPKRTNIVISATTKEFPGCTTVSTIEEALKAIENENEAFVIGGGTIYKHFLPIAGKLYLTVVDCEPEADTFFPDIDFTDWQKTTEEQFQASEKNDFNFTFTLYKRKI